jgi:prepilin-type N-terminal cleavage/methylation domain-containing protein
MKISPASFPSVRHRPGNRITFFDTHGKGRRASRGFTLIEMLVAIALFGMLFSAIVVVLVQVQTAWVTQIDDPVADRHVDGLDRFVRSAFVESGPAGVTEPNDEQRSQENAFLSLTVPSDLPWIGLLAQDGGAIEARLAMAKDGPGLWLYWNTARERTAKNLQAHRMLVSAWVKAARIYVYDTDSTTWTESVPGAQSAGTSGAGSATSFRVLQLEVDRAGQTRTLRIPIPRTET